MITKEEFYKYEGVRVSGVTNMFNVSLVCKLSGLDSEKVLEIIENYTKLSEEFLK